MHKCLCLPCGWGVCLCVCNGFMRLSLKVYETGLCMCACISTLQPCVFSIWLYKFEDYVCMCVCVYRALWVLSVGLGEEG